MAQKRRKFEEYMLVVRLSIMGIWKVGRVIVKAVSAGRKMWLSPAVTVCGSAQQTAQPPVSLERAVSALFSSRASSSNTSCATLSRR